MKKRVLIGFLWVLGGFPASIADVLSPCEERTVTLADMVASATSIALYRVSGITPIDEDIFAKSSERAFLYSMTSEREIKGHPPLFIKVIGAEPVTGTPDHFFSTFLRHEQMANEPDAIQGATYPVLMKDKISCTYAPHLKQNYRYLVFEGVEGTANFEMILDPAFDAWYRSVLEAAERLKAD